ncbi:MAG: PCRF domain-containing protein [Clostridia bacterium]|nr:PCRF domain-containing protein [Clostridia bacterium]
MYGIYGDIISAAEKAIGCLDETEELLEYPEVQADKAYYLSVLSKYNDLKSLNDKLCALKSVLEEQNAYYELISDASSSEERNTVYEEISSLKIKASELSSSIADTLGCNHTAERAYCRFKFKEGSYKFGVALCNLIKSYLCSRGAKFEDENIAKAKGGYVEEISFIVEGADVITRLMPLVGAHKVYKQSGSEELCFAVTPCESVEKISEKDLKIDVFHSSGAGGQNVNKVETAVRVTHLPTGLVVVCQDERSQLKNKKRALENIQKRLKEINEQSEKKRIEADVFAQYSKKNTPISFDLASSTLTDTRLKAFSKIPFPLTEGQFAQYINGLIAL